MDIRPTRAPKPMVMVLLSRPRTVTVVAILLLAMTDRRAGPAARNTTNHTTVLGRWSRAVPALIL